MIRNNEIVPYVLQEASLSDGLTMLAALLGLIRAFFAYSYTPEAVFMLSPLKTSSLFLDPS